MRGAKTAPLWALVLVGGWEGVSWAISKVCASWRGSSSPDLRRREEAGQRLDSCSSERRELNPGPPGGSSLPSEAE